MINGVINVYKEPGYTSHDVVAKLRGILKQKKIGHMGTLDPNAVGVLPVCLGKATKLCNLLSEKDKTYTATMLLGTETDTQDTTGQITNQTPEEEVMKLSEEKVFDVIKSYIGEYDQIPPMFSAIKINGQKLYNLARKGEEIEKQIEDMKQGEFSDKDIQNAKELIIASIKSMQDEQDSEISYCFGRELMRENIDAEEDIRNIEQVTKEQIVKIAKSVQINTIYFLTNQ